MVAVLSRQSTKMPILFSTRPGCSLPRRDDIDYTYIRRMGSEEKVDGVWVAKRKRNDYWDCECCSALAAIFRKLILF